MKSKQIFIGLSSMQIKQQIAFFIMFFVSKYTEPINHTVSELQPILIYRSGLCYLHIHTQEPHQFNRLLASSIEERLPSIMDAHSWSKNWPCLGLSQNLRYLVRCTYLCGRHWYVMVVNGTLDVKEMFLNSDFNDTRIWSCDYVRNKREAMITGRWNALMKLMY